MKEFKISMVCTDSTAKFGPIVFRDISSESFKVMKDMGFNGVELNIKDPAKLNAHTFGDMIGKAGLPVTAVGTGRAFGEEGLSFTHPDPDIRIRAINRIREHVDFSVHIGKPQIIIGLIRGKVFEGIGEEQSRAWMESALAECATYAGERDVRLTVEPINRYETALVNNVSEGLELTERLGFENIGLLLDTFHMNIEEPVIEESINKAGDKIFHFHIADSNRWAPGFGHIDFMSVISALHRIGYQGYISGELLPLPDGITAAQRTYEKMAVVYENILHK